MAKSSLLKRKWPKVDFAEIYAGGGPETGIQLGVALVECCSATVALSSV